MRAFHRPGAGRRGSARARRRSGLPERDGALGPPDGATGAAEAVAAEASLGRPTWHMPPVQLALLLRAGHRGHRCLHHGEGLLLLQQQRRVRRVRAHVVPAALLPRRLALRAALPPAVIVPPAVVIPPAVSPIIVPVSSIVVSAVVVPVSAVVIPTAVVVPVVRAATRIRAIGVSPTVIVPIVRPLVRTTRWLRASIRSAVVLPLLSAAIVRAFVSTAIHRAPDRRPDAQKCIT